MAYGRPSTTNNYAEYQGLLQGLLHAHKAHLNPIHVVGDSQLIVKQQRDRRAPKAPHLRTLYQRCRSTADKCGVVTWTHHYRAFNRTADALANLAMNTACSRQTDLDASREPRGPWDLAF